MRNIFFILVMALFATQVFAKQCPSLLDHNVRKLGDTEELNLCEAYKGKVLLIVNTASKCAYTDQYDSLEKLYAQYKDEGLVVLGFPSNDFGQQEPGSEKQIKSFCRLTYGVKFPMFAKTGVTRHNASPFYQSLAEASGTYPKWNFHKYLIDRDGSLVTQYVSATDPLDDLLVSDIEKQIIINRKSRF